MHSYRTERYRVTGVNSELQEYRRTRGAMWHYRRDCHMWPKEECDVILTRRELNNLCQCCMRLKRQERKDQKFLPK